MTLLQSSLTIPSFLLGAFLAESHLAPASSSNSLEKNLAVQTLPSAPRASTSNSAPTSNQMNFVLQRKERIQRVLLALDRVAAVTQQMKPENAERIEPVIADLAEQAIDLANEKALQAESTDATLTKLETTVGELVRTMNRYVEPEASL